MSLVSYLPPLPPPLHTSQLTETWQWPTCTCWQPKLTLLFWSHWRDWGKSCPLLLFHSWNAPVLPCASRAGSATTWDAWASASALCSAWLQVQSSSWPSILQVEPSSPLPAGVVKALLSWAVTLFSSNCKRTQPSAAWWDPLSLPQHTHAGWPLLPCDSALFSRSRCVCKLLCITCTVSFLLEHRLLFLD